MRPAAAAVHRARTRRLKLAGSNAQARTRRARTLRGQNSAGPELCGARTRGARDKGHARPNAQKPYSGASARVQGIRSMGLFSPDLEKAAAADHEASRASCKGCLRLPVSMMRRSAPGANMGAKKDVGLRCSANPGHLARLAGERTTAL